MSRLEPPNALPTMRTLPLLLLLPALALASCGGGSDPKDLYSEGQTALSSGDYSTAVARFDAAVAALEAAGQADSTLYVDAAIGGIEARIRTAPDQARTDFLELAKARPADLEPKDYSYVGNKFAAASRYLDAVEVLDAGMKAHAESPELHQLQVAIQEAATKAGDQAALDKMKGLGYL